MPSVEGHALVKVLADSLEKPLLDKREYRVVCLPNDLEVLLAHDAQTDWSSAALDVNVGNFSDEEGMPGLAHAVEHLLFMGTKKYPIENDYGHYLSSNSGSSNAYTASTSTNFYFDVAARAPNDEPPSDTNPSPLREALDRFAQFFIEPLFLSDALDRELKAVDSENKNNLQNDARRLNQLEKSMSNPKHPYCQFGTGSFEDLKTIPEASGINVRDKFIEFYGKHYSANRMKLVVLGRESLDDLQKWVVEFFSPIINKNLPMNRWTTERPFRESELGIQWFAKPVMDFRELKLQFPFIDEEGLHGSWPSRYLSHLIGHEGPGSIMAYAKSKGWAESLSAGAYSICPGTPDLFNVIISLTEEGLKQYEEITKIFFQYISLLQESPATQWIFEEQKGMDDVNFKFKENRQGSGFTSNAAATMQESLPREWLLSGSCRLRSFGKEQIETALAIIRPESLRLGIVSRNFPGVWDKKEKWYGTEYRLERIPPQFMKGLQEAISVTRGQRLPELHLPHKNRFIPQKLEVEKNEVNEPSLAPQILRNDQHARTWWKKDDTFCVPKADVIVSLKNPIIQATAENSIKALLFIKLVEDALEKDFYDARLAGLHYAVAVDSRGLRLEVCGYNDKLPVLLECIAENLRDIEIKDNRFDIMHEDLTRSFDNWQLLPPHQQVSSYMRWLNTERDYCVAELTEALQGVTIDLVRQFRLQFISQMHIEAYVHGNLYRGDAIKVTDQLVTIFENRVPTQTQSSVSRSLILPPGSNNVYKKMLKDPANFDHCVETWFYIGDYENREIRAKSFLIDQMIAEPAFDQLRTKDQLGYMVFAHTHSFATTCGFRFLIQSERTPDYLDKCIEAFLVRFYGILEQMGDSDFKHHKQCLINKLLKKPENLGDETTRHWAQIGNERYDFECAQLDAAFVEHLTKAEMKQFYTKNFLPTSPTRARISVHLYARGAAERALKVAAALEKAGYAYVPEEKRSSREQVEEYLGSKQLPAKDIASIMSELLEIGLLQKTPASEIVEETNSTSAIESAVEIKDVARYKAGLSASSGPRAVKDVSEFVETDSQL